MLTILIPTLNRSHILKQRVENALANSPAGTTVLLIIDDEESHKVCMENNFDFHLYAAPYPAKINEGYRYVETPYFFIGADDLNFHPNWFEEALKMEKPVVGINDLVGTGPASTHFLVYTKYIQEKSGVLDMPNTVMYPYLHNFCDAELWKTTTYRGDYTYAKDSIVEHMHPSVGKALEDDINRKNQSTFALDEATFNERKHLWEK